MIGLRVPRTQAWRPVSWESLWASLYSARLLVMNTAKEIATAREFAVAAS